MSNIRTYEITHSKQKLLSIKQKDSTDYLLGGSLIMKNGKIDKVLFDGGYAQASVASATTDKFAFYYYNQDHLGNNREVVDEQGNVVQTTNYYPFGAPYADASATLNSNFQPYKYNGKELDLMHGLNTYDYGARQHDPILARWDRIDPLCEKYYSTSPYNYCLNNPVMLIDPDGRKIEIYKNASQEFKQKVETVIAYLKEKGVGDVINQLEKSETVITIRESPYGKDHFNPRSNEIWWDPTLVLVTNEDVRLSPATCFNHEADHALQKLTMSKEEYEKKNKDGSDPQYDTILEKETIEGTEQRTALALGEIQEGQVTRKDHDSHANEYTNNPLTTGNY